ncbi:TonB-dependent siderophore receptor [Phormidesmis priestleyi]
MKNLKSLLLWSVMAASSLVAQSASAESDSRWDGQTERAIKTVRDLDLFELPARSRPATTVREWLSQTLPPQAPVQVTGVRLNSTDAGLEIILQTTSPTQLQAVRSVEDKTVTIEISNAVLSLPNQQAFQADNPTETITATQLEGNRIRVQVVGKTTLQNVTVIAQPNSVSEQPDEDEEEITVTGEQQRGYRVPKASTATRTDTPLRDVPASIQVIPQEVLRDQAINSSSNPLGNAVQNVSGVNNLGLYGGFAQSLRIRGFNVGTFDGSYFRDGIRLFTFGTPETFDLEQIEVLKGPASVLFGEAQPGGIINLVTKKPLRDPRYSLEGSAGSFRSVQVGADFSGPLNPEKTALYRFNGYYSDAGSFRDFVTRERVFLAPVLQFSLGKNTTLTVDAAWSNETRTSDDGFVAIGDGVADLPRNRFIGEPFQNVRINDFSIGYLLNHRFSDQFTLRNSLRVQWVNPERYFPLRDSLDEATGDLSLLRYFAAGEYKTISTQTNLISKFSTGSIEHQLLFGVDYSRQTDKPKFGGFDDYRTINIFNPTYSRLQYPKAELLNFFRDDAIDKVGVYLQDQIELTSNLKLLAGGRFDSYFQKRSTQDLGEPKQEFEQSDSRLSPRFGIVYQPTRSLSLYASYTTSFQASFGTNRNGDGSPFAPEIGQQLEAGIKADLNRNLSATLAFYDLRKKNVTTDDPASSDPNDQVQTGEQRSRGIEFDLVGEIVSGWKVIASYAYTDALVSDDRSGFEDNRLDNTPKNAASLWTTYEMQQGSLRGLGFGLGAYFVGDRFGDLSNTYVLPSYVRADAAIFYQRDNWRAAVNFRNLFNKKYFTGSDEGRLGVYIGDPFTVTGSLSFSF